MPKERACGVLRRAVALLVVALSGGCGGGEESLPARCGEASLSSARVRAGSLVEVQGLSAPDGAFRVRLSAAVFAEPLEPLAVWDEEETVARFRAPARIETMDRDTEYRVEYIVEGSGEEQACDLGPLVATALPEPGDYTVESLVGDLQGSLDETASKLGWSRAELLDAPEAHRPVLAPLFAAQYIIDHPDNAHSLRRIVEGRAGAHWDLAPDEREFLDRLLAAREPGLRSLDGGIAACGTALTGIETPEELACWIGVNRSVRETLASDTAKGVRATLGYLIAAAGFFTKGVAVPYIALANFVVNQMIDGLENMTPSKLGYFVPTLTHFDLCDYESGTIEKVELSAQSNGWQITPMTIIDGFFSIAGVGLAKAAVADDAARAAGELSDSGPVDSLALDVLGMIRDAWANFTGLYVNVDSVLEIPPRTFGPVELTRPDWYTLDNPDGKLDVTGMRYEGVDMATGTARMWFTLRSERFHGLEAEHVASIELREFSVDIHPVYAKAGEQLRLTATVHCFEDPHLVWVSDETDGAQMVDQLAGDYRAPICSDAYGHRQTDPRICWYQDEIGTRLTNNDAPSEEFRATVRVGECCQETPPVGCTRQERCDCDDPPSICDGPIVLRPSDTCVPPDGRVRFEVYSDFGDTPDAVRWTVRAPDLGPAGDVDDGGTFVAPGRETTVVVRAENPDDPSVAAESTVAVSSTCARWAVDGTPLASFTGDQVVIPFARGLPGDEQERFQINLSQRSGSGAAGVIQIPGYPGRDEDCHGPTGTFVGFVSAAVNTGTDVVGGEALHADEARIRIRRFDPGLLSLTFRGTGEYAARGLDEPVEVPIQGHVELPSSGCRSGDLPGSPDAGLPDGGLPDGSVSDGGVPMDASIMWRLLGHLQPAPGTCVEYYAGPDYQEGTWEGICEANASTCGDGAPCASSGRLGQCDLRRGGTSADTAQIQHYYEAGEIEASDAMQFCEASGGRWSDG